MINKEKLIQKSIEYLGAEIKDFESIIESESKSLINAPHAMQSWSDTSRSQKEDLLFGLTKQISEKRKALSSLRSVKIIKHDTIQEGSLVSLIENQEKMIFFIIPGNVGNELEVEGEIINVVSPASIVARSLYGHKKGDTVEVKVPAGVRIFEISSVI